MKVLPTSDRLKDEWYKAAYYDPNKDLGGAETGGYWLYATGSDDAPTAILEGGDTADNTAVYLRREDRWPHGTDDFNARFPDDGYPEDVHQSGGLSAYGTMGQGGNVFEWLETEQDGHFGRRGGFYSHPASNLRATEVRFNVSGAVYSTGFRVMMIPEPGSAMLLLIGAVAVTMRRRRRVA